MTTGLFVGRFQPFHNGHLADVELVLRDCEEVVIVVGSAQESRTHDNPFNVEERCKLIDAALHEAGISAYQIVVLEDINDDSAWVEYVGGHVGSYDRVYTGNDHVASLFKEAGVDVTQVPIIDEITATRIRARMASGGQWEVMVPNAVVGKIKALDLRKYVK